jgi:hypothetical protein
MRVGTLRTASSDDGDVVSLPGSFRRELANSFNVAA